MSVRSLDEPIPTVTAGGTHIALAQPVPATWSEEADCQLAGAQPYVFPLNQGKERLRGHRSVGHPLCTITATGTDLGLVEGVWRSPCPNCDAPITNRCFTNDPRPKSSTCPQCGHVNAIAPDSFILNRHGDNGSSRAHSLDVPMPAADCRGAGYLIEPFMLSQASGGAPRAVEDPLPTVPCGGAHALIAPYYGAGSGQTCNTVDAPLPTVTTKGRFGLVKPFITPYYGNTNGEPRRSRSIDAPLATQTAENRFGIVMPVTHGDASNRLRCVDEPIPTVTCANRGELAFIAASFGERPGQAPRVHSVDHPTPTICAEGRVNLVEPGPHLDILFRMLHWSELAAATSFPKSYEFAGGTTAKTRQIGNAVPIYMATALVTAMFEDHATPAHPIARAA